MLPDGPVIEDEDDDDDDNYEDEVEAIGSVCNAFSLQNHTGQVGDTNSTSKQSRSENKSRKAMLKLGMESIPGVRTRIYCLSFRSQMFSRVPLQTLVLSLGRQILRT
ncbi:uncharacterized protein [Elaeis guineensis]|uniref:uncharacterized protein isoform X1 n=1 Tax=Elaeis guineensis var. tenera TaxID=51953 RepID=UPI003C6CD16A